MTRHVFVAVALGLTALAGAGSPIGAQQAGSSVVTVRPPHVSDSVSALRRAQLDAARAAGLRLGSIRAAERAGYRRIAPRSITDLTPFMGEHWLNARLLRSPTVRMTRPAYLMFYPLPSNTEEPTLVGLAYGILQPTGAPVPDGFAGPLDRWHVHLPCADVPGLKSTLAHGVSDCLALGGRPGATQIAMVHVWLGVPNPDGPFAPSNPALPYVATELTPPTAAELHDPQRGPMLRALGLALGETFHAVPRLGGLVDVHPDSTFAVRVAPHRARIRELLPGLREAQTETDRQRFDLLAHAAITEWEAIRAAYMNTADGALPILIGRWYDAALTPPPTPVQHPQ